MRYQTHFVEKNCDKIFLLLPSSCKMKEFFDPIWVHLQVFFATFDDMEAKSFLVNIAIDA